MDSHRIREILYRQLEDAARMSDAAAQEFNEIIRDVPSGLPHPDGTSRIQNASRRRSSTHNAMMNALRRLNDFTINGTVPDDIERHIPSTEQQ